jgi:hypothetical protein
MKKNNNTKMDKIKVKHKKAIITLMLLGVMIIPASALVITLFEKPLTSVDMITLTTLYENANNQAYGWGEVNNSTCAPIHFQVPYKQTHETTYIRLGYFPLCLTPAEQSQYPDHYMTLFCENEYVQTWNITENCVDNGGVYDAEWVSLSTENATAGLFQSDKLTTLFSCMFCVNYTGNDLPNRTDFWIRAENTGNQVTVEYHNETIFPDLEIVTNAISGFVGVIASIISYGGTLLNFILIIASPFILLMFFIFMLIRFRDRIKDALNKR